VCGAECSLDGVSTAGLTDYEVMEVALRTSGHPAEPATTTAVLASYERRLASALHRRRGRVMPGVREILDEVRAGDQAVSLLLTGNTAAGARAKLTHYGLNDYFKGAGAFCSGPGPREAIAREAAALAAQRLGGVPSAEQLIVLGDSPQDVRCGRAIGARTIAVATGPVARPELEACGAWRVIDRLPSPEQFGALLGLAPLSR
jgi:phosphoglycolate phosphatase